MLYDVVVIGGGINGCGCAADAALRGLSVLLCEQHDLASKTSSSSSKLIHGGLRYLERYELRMVKHALDEQATLMKTAPHLVHALAFILPNQHKLRPTWLLRLGLFLYDNLSRHNPLPNSKLLKRAQQPNYFSSLDASLETGFLYYDCLTDDARLTISVALLAQEHGAKILTHTTLIDATATPDYWLLTLQPQHGRAFQVPAKTVINAAGPWVPQVAKYLHLPIKRPLSYVKGSHIVVPALYEGDHAYMLQNTDKRIVFVIPYHGYSLIGTTDLVIKNPSDNHGITDTEITYLSDIIQHYFNKTIATHDIITSWSGVRLLLSNTGKSAPQLSRDYVIEASQYPVPALTIYGGKLTAYRQLASEAIDTLRSVFPLLPESLTQKAQLPGSHWQESSNFDDYKTYAKKKYTWIHQTVLQHYLDTYGTRTEIILEDCQQLDDLGKSFGNVLYQIEVDYLIKHEWAQSVEDIIWRRTKLGLSMSAIEQEALENYMKK